MERAEGKAAWIPNKILQAGPGQVETSQYVHEAGPKLPAGREMMKVLAA